MSNRHFWSAVFAAGLAALAPSASFAGSAGSWRFGAGAELGFQNLALGDLSDSMATVAAAATAAGDVASFDEPGFSFVPGLSAWAEYRLSEGRGLGLSVGYRMLGASYREAVTKTSNQKTTAVSLDLDVSAVPVSVFYRAPAPAWTSGLGRLRPADWTAQAGIDLYSADVEFDRTTTEPSKADKFKRGTFEEGAVGWHACLGAEWPLRGAWSLGVSFGWRSAKLGALDGTLVDQGGASTPETLIMKRDLATGREGLDITSAPLASNERTAELDLSGPKVAFEARYRFGGE